MGDSLPYYRRKLVDLIDKHVIKILVGMHGSGKSTVFAELTDDLIEHGIAEEHIFFVDFAAVHYGETLAYDAMRDFLTATLANGEKAAVFLDGLPDIAAFDGIIGSLYINRRLNIFVSVANRPIAAALTASLPSGATTTMEVVPVCGGEEPFGSALPYAEGRPFDKRCGEYMAGLMARTVLEEIVGRRQFRDTELLRTLFCEILKALNEDLSAPKLAAKLTAKTAGRKISVHTVTDYLAAFYEALIVYPVPRFDVESGAVLRSAVRYYVTDPGGFCTFFLGQTALDKMRTALWHNAVFLALLRQGGTVYVGKSGAKIVDFVHITADNTPTYWQIAPDEAAKKAKLRVLAGIADQYPKRVLTLFDTPDENVKGIVVMNASRAVCGNFDVRDF